MKRIGIVILAVFAIGCAKLSLETVEPIKVDINMRVDVYQHVVEDVKSVNDQIYGGPEKNFNSLFSFGEAYAADLSGEMALAISRRKARVNIIEGYFTRGYIGENKDAFLELRGSVSSQERSRIRSVVSEENKDREVIYKATAQKNGTNVSAVRKVFFEGDYNRAPSGYWFQTPFGGRYTWKKK